MADTAVASGWRGPVLEWRARLRGAVTDRLAAEGDRRLLWLPVFFGAGIGVYFILKVEPPLWLGTVAVVAGGSVVLALRRYAAWCEAALALTLLAAGFALMCETAREREAAMLQRHVGPVVVSGRVIDVDLVERAGGSSSKMTRCPVSIQRISRAICGCTSRHAAMNSIPVTVSASRPCFIPSRRSSSRAERLPA
jgi:competence protein ComEC